MTIHTIGPTRVVVYFTPAELRDRGCTAETLDEELAAPLVRRALREEGIAAEGKMEIDAFPSDCGLLLFVHLTPPGRQWFSFGGLEELLAAARGGGVPPEDAVLCWYGDRWWLSLPPEEKRWGHILSEFGRPERERPALDAALREYGAVIFPQRAFSRLLAYFPRN